MFQLTMPHVQYSDWGVEPFWPRWTFIIYVYWNIPVHLNDHWLLGMTWRQGVFIDMVLPFALRSTLKIFNVVVDTLEWIVWRDGVREMLPLP